MPDFDIVIAGSGLGGLICGNILSKEGMKVCILEKNNQIGGCLQTFKRNNVVFDTGVHYIGSLGEGQITNRYFRYLGIFNKLKLKELDKDAFEIIDYGGKEYRFASGYDHFEESLSSQFPGENKAIAAYCSKLKEVVRELRLYNLEATEYMNITDSEHITVNAHDYIASLTDNITLRNVLAGTNQLYYGDKFKTPLYIHAVLSHSLIESAWRPVDGGSQIATLLAGEIVRNGGVIRTKVKVEKFTLHNGKIEAALTDSHEEIRGRIFISDIHPTVTIGMIDNGALKKAYRSRISDLNNSGSVFTVYAVLKKNTFRYLNSNLYYYRVNDVWDGLNYSEQSWPGGYVLMTPAASGSDDYAESAIIMTFMKYEDVRRWENTFVENRGDEYHQFKNEKALKLISVIEEKYPGFSSCIQSFYTSTPLTYRDYTATPEGSVYGVIKDCNNILKNYVTARTPVQNLLFTGQNVNMHGVTGVCIGALQTCGELLGVNYLIDKIKMG